MQPNLNQFVAGHRAHGGQQRDDSRSARLGDNGNGELRIEIHAAGPILAAELLDHGLHLRGVSDSKTGEHKTTRARFARVFGNQAAAAPVGRLASRTSSSLPDFTS